MTYDAYELSVQLGEPIELFEFIQGATAWRTTSHDQDVIWGGNTWTATPLGRSEIEQTDEMTKNALILRLPRTHAFAAQFIGQTPDQVTTLTLRRGHLSDPEAEFTVAWKGRVSGASVNGAEVELNCESIFTSLRRAGLRARYQIPCRHVLYGRGCNVDRAAYAEISAASVVGVQVAASVASAQADGWYSGGMIVAPDGAARFIIAHVGAVLTLMRTFDSLQALTDNAGYGRNYGNYYGGVPVTLYPGCDHSKATCHDKFDNLPNYGGFPYIPARNPLDGHSIV